MPNYTRNMAGLFLLASSLLFGCGTSSTSNSGGEADTTLAEVTANFPREGYSLQVAPPVPTTGAVSTVEEIPRPDSIGAGSFAISSFLWKPISDSTGNVAVLVNPTNVSVVVSGAVSETLDDVGPSNGRGTTARGEHPGCDYGGGGNVIVSFFRNGEQIGLADGSLTVNVGDGCDRIEFDL